MRAHVLRLHSPRVPRLALPHAAATDDRLADLVSTGDEEAFSALYRRHHQAIYRYCRSIVGEETDAQDALQATFAAVLVGLRRARPDAPLRPWLFRIAHNESISLLRRRRDTVELSQARERPSPSAEEAAGERERFALLISDLGELGERQRGALVMRELSGLSHAEIAVALGLTVNSAKQTIFDARVSLAEFAEGRAMACEEIRHAISDGDGRALRTRRVRSHMRACAACSEFAAAIPRRRSELRALAPPLAPPAAAGLLGRLLGGASSHGGGGTAVAAGAAGVAGKSAGALLIAKSLVAVAVVATGAVGVVAVTKGSHAGEVRSPAPGAFGRAPGGVLESTHLASALSLRAPVLGLARHTSSASPGRARRGAGARVNAPTVRGHGSQDAAHSRSPAAPPRGRPLRAATPQRPASRRRGTPASPTSPSGHPGIAPAKHPPKVGPVAGAPPRSGSSGAREAPKPTPTGVGASSSPGRAERGGEPRSTGRSGSDGTRVEAATTIGP
jgi:RNA polymerase sigma factor (sigma-70 family)